ncbi:MAG: hypothetical protein QOC82_1845 [Frankiaceae bacterium]|jgi:hypothetical protein|nr:hypothetical protein [Frankiaceae bacterium]
MRTNKLRLLTLAASIGVVATMLPGQAATPAAAHPQITDATGDANAINNQGFGIGPDVNVSAPADDANADITSVLFATKFKTVTTTKTVTTIVKKKKVTKKVTVKTQVPDGFTVTMNLSAAPDANHAYDVYATHPLCDGQIDFTYSTGELGLNEIDCIPADPTSTDIASFGGEASVVGNSVVWTVPAGAFANGTSFSELSAQTATAALTPIMDTASGSATYKVGS